MTKTITEQELELEQNRKIAAMRNTFALAQDPKAEQLSYNDMSLKEQSVWILVALAAEVTVRTQITPSVQDSAEVLAKMRQTHDAQTGKKVNYKKVSKWRKYEAAVWVMTLFAYISSETKTLKPDLKTTLSAFFKRIMRRLLVLLRLRTTTTRQHPQREGCNTPSPF